MSGKFHVNTETGTTGICKAEKVACPLGGDSGNENHFDSAEEAVIHAEKIMESKYDTIASHKSSGNSSKVTKNEEPLYQKVDLTKMDIKNMTEYQLETEFERTHARWLVDYYSSEFDTDHYSDFKALERRDEIAKVLNIATSEDFVKADRIFEEFTKSVDGELREKVKQTYLANQKRGIEAFDQKFKELEAHELKGIKEEYSKYGSYRTSDDAPDFVKSSALKTLINIRGRYSTVYGYQNDDYKNSVEYEKVKQMALDYSENSLNTAESKLSESQSGFSSIFRRREIEENRGRVEELKEDLDYLKKNF